jgi:hypothetical protein
MKLGRVYLIYAIIMFVLVLAALIVGGIMLKRITAGLL